MASSFPSQKAQSFSVCQFCRESHKIKYKCVNCKLFLCKVRTSKIHSRIQNAQEQLIIQLSDCGTEKSAKLHRKEDLMDMDCNAHKIKKCINMHHCTECDQPICADCIITTHRKYAHQDLQEIYEVKLRTVKERESISSLKEKEKKL